MVPIGIIRHSSCDLLLENTNYSITGGLVQVPAPRFPPAGKTLKKNEPGKDGDNQTDQKPEQVLSVDALRFFHVDWDSGASAIYENG